jgi:hypothetical protein
MYGAGEVNESIAAQIAKVNTNIRGVLGRRRIALIALCMQYSAKALQLFRVKQRGRTFWNNQTYTALNTVFSNPLITEDVVGFYLSHLQEYGIYLELANDRKHEALRPIVAELEGEFLEKVRRLME